MLNTEKYKFILGRKKPCKLSGFIDFNKRVEQEVGMLTKCILLYIAFGMDIWLTSKLIPVKFQGIHFGHNFWS